MRPARRMEVDSIDVVLNKTFDEAIGKFEQRVPAADMPRLLQLTPSYSLRWLRRNGPCNPTCGDHKPLSAVHR